MSVDRELLQRVAAGELTPEEAMRLLDAGGVLSADLPPAEAVTRLRVECELGGVTVLGDSGVRTATASGPHEASTRGDTITVTSPDDSVGLGLGLGVGFRFGGRGRRGRELVVRANPALDLDIEVSAGRVTVRGMDGRIGAKVAAGSLRLDGFRGPLDLAVDAGSVAATGRLVDGESRIRCELGTVAVHLDRSSSVRISAKTELGRITLPGGTRVGGIGTTRHEAVISDGRGRLDLVATAGKIDVTA